MHGDWCQREIRDPRARLLGSHPWCDDCRLQVIAVTVKRTKSDRKRDWSDQSQGSVWIVSCLARHALGCGRDREEPYFYLSCFLSVEIKSLEKSH